MSIWRNLGSIVRKTGQAVDELGALIQGRLAYRETGAGCGIIWLGALDRQLCFQVRSSL